MSDVIFRRVRGRIVPIKVKKDKRLSGSTIAATGAITATGSNLVAGKLFRKGVEAAEKSAKYTEASSRAFKVNNTIFGFEFLKKSSKQARKTRKFLGASKGLRVGGTLIGGSLVGVGIERAIEQRLGRQLDVSGELAANVAGLGVVGVANQAFKTGATRKLLKILSKGKL